VHNDADLPPLRQPLADLRAELADSQVIALGWRDGDGRLLAAVRGRASPDAAVAEIGRLTVVPDRQGQGLGSRLLTALEDQLPPAIRELRLFTGERSEANLRLYARLGYSETSRKPTPAGYAVVHLHKTRGVKSPRPRG
jgi:GNAT superfamily N-acetyltransferase